MRERVRDHLADRPGVRAHDDDAVAEEDGLLDQVRDEEHALQAEVAARPEAVDLGAQRLGGQHVERGERLVHAEQLGAADERARDADALLHAARELLRVRLLEALEADEIDGAVDALGGVRAADAAAVEADADVLGDRQPRVEREALEDDRRAGMHAAERHAVAEHLAGGRRDEAGHDAQERRLAAARRTEHDGHLAGLDREAHVAQHEQLAPVALEALRDVSHLDQGVGVGRVRGGSRGRHSSAALYPAARGSSTGLGARLGAAPGIHGRRPVVRLRQRRDEGRIVQRVGGPRDVGAARAEVGDERVEHRGRGSGRRGARRGRASPRRRGRPAPSTRR